MNNKIEMVGKRFGRLVILEYVGTTKWRLALWNCYCDCGNTIIVIGSNLRKGVTKSCGCLSAEKTKERFTKHGMSGTPANRSWHAMIDRCNNPDHLSYKNYGGRGITVCDRWLKFENFFEDLGERPDNLTLERKDNELGYFKENCCWETRTKQQRNQRTSKRNKTGIRGIYWDKHRQKYHVQIKLKYWGNYENL